MSTKEEIELRAAAAAAYVLDAILILATSAGSAYAGPRLRLADGSVEPLEVTRHIDQRAFETWDECT
jgi:hypothetical protein